MTAFRLSHLSSAAQELLRVAAIAGNGFPIGVVAKILDQPALALLEPLEESTAAGFVVPGDRGRRLPVLARTDPHRRACRYAGGRAATRPRLRR